MLLTQVASRGRHHLVGEPAVTVRRSTTVLPAAVAARLPRDDDDHRRVLAVLAWLRLAQ